MRSAAERRPAREASAPPRQATLSKQWALALAGVLALTPVHAAGVEGSAAVAAASAVAASTPMTAAAAGPHPSSGGRAAALTQDDVYAATATLRADPQLGGTRTVRSWRFKRDEPDPAPREAPPDIGWLRDLARWLAEGGRGLAWLLGAVAVTLLLVSARRWILLRGDPLAAPAAMLPSHVRDLDIRPESLPADIGAAARAHWLAGEDRAALALLYRGALSRLVHRHGLPIGGASTEGECVRLAEGALRADAADYVRRLIRAWQFAVYGAHRPDDAAVLGLCDEFDRHLGRPAAAADAAATVATRVRPA